MIDAPVHASRHLPDELLLEVLRNTVLSPSDLARCALLCHRYLDSVRKWLYERVEVEMLRLPEDAIDQDDLELNQIEYASKAWKLLRTLKERKGLAELVRTIRFDAVEDLTRDADSTLPEGEKIETTTLLTLSTFLRLAPNVKRVSWGQGWGKSLGYIRTIAKFKNVEELSVDVFDGEELEAVSEHLPSLRQLHVVIFYKDETRRPTVPAVNLSNLRVLDVTHDKLGKEHVDFYMKNASTLTELKTDPTVAYELDYKEFTNLRSLHVHSIGFRSGTTSTAEARHVAEQFWASLVQAPALETLSFGGARFGILMEEALFNPRYLPVSTATFGEGGGPLKPIPTLRTIRFTESVGLDRLNSILSGPLSKTLTKVSIPSRFGRDEANRRQKNELIAVSAMCRDSGIELMLADDRFPLHDLDPALSLSRSLHNFLHPPLSISRTDLAPRPTGTLKKEIFELAIPGGKVDG